MKDIAKFLGAFALSCLAVGARAESWAPSVAAVLKAEPVGLTVVVGRPVHGHPRGPGWRHPGRPGHPGRHGRIVVERSRPRWDRRRVTWAMHDRAAQLRRRGVRVLSSSVNRSPRGFYYEIRYRTRR